MASYSEVACHPDSKSTSKSSCDKSTQFDDPDVDSVPERRPRIHWRYPALTLLLFVAGILLAVGHDIYYKSLDSQDVDFATSNDESTATDAGSPGGSSGFFSSLVGRNVSQQTWAIRIGTGLAFLSKTALSVVVGLVGAQQIWYTLRRKNVSINTIDGMFQIMENPLALLNWGILWHAKLLSVLALVSWLLPLASIVTPSTLSVQSASDWYRLPLDVPGQNFSDYSSWIATEGAGYITGANFEISTLFSILYSSTKFIPQNLVYFPDASYNQSFYAPSYKCISLNEALATDITPTWTVGNPKNEANTTYKTFEDAFYGELQVPRVHDADKNLVVMSPTIYSAAAPDYMFNTIMLSAGGDNTLWNAQGKNNNTFINSTKDGDGTHSFYSGPSGSNIVCQLYNTSFAVTVNFTNGVQSITEQEIKFLEPQAWNGRAGAESLLGSCSGVNTSYPRLAESDPWSFSSRGNCNQTLATYYVTHLLFSYLLSADLRLGVDGSVPLAGKTTIPLLQSPFIHCPDVYNSSHFNGSELSSNSNGVNPTRCRNGTLAAAIEDMSRNFTYSLWGYDGWQRYSEASRVDATFKATVLFFTYDRGTLWAVYGSAIGATFLTLLVGARALLHNGVVSSTSFSSILLTTRNPQLHESIIQGTGAAACQPSTSYTRSLGAQPIDKDVGKLRLRFGRFANESGVPQAGFGVEGTVRPFRHMGSGQETIA